MNFDDRSAMDRRDLIRKGLVGVGIAATAPVAMSINVRAAAAASDPAPTATCDATDTSGSNMMGPTNVTISGAIPGATVFIYNGEVVTGCTGTPYGEVEADSNGDATITLGSSAGSSTGNGPNSIYVSQDDGTGEGLCSALITCT